MLAFLKYLQDEGAVIAKAPLIFGLAVALVAGIIWAAVRHQYGERLANLESRLKARDDRIADLARQVSEEPSSEDGQRHYLLGRLMVEYTHSHADAPIRVKKHLDLPPAEWLNAELEKLGERWRVANVRGNKCDFLEM